VHGKEAIEDIGSQQIVIRDGKLQANGHGHKPCDNQERDGRADVH
jgi:hypothetical protein